MERMHLLLNTTSCFNAVELIGPLWLENFGIISALKPDKFISLAEHYIFLISRLRNLMSKLGVCNRYVSLLNHGGFKRRHTHLLFIVYLIAQFHELMPDLPLCSAIRV